MSREVHMLDNRRIAPGIGRHAGLVELLPEGDETLGLRCRVHHVEGNLDAWTWLKINPDECLQGVKGHAVTMAIDHDGADHLLVAFEPDPDIALQGLLAGWLCPIDGVVTQIAAMVDGLSHLPLRRFVSDALLLPDAMRHFWNRPASWSHHHAYTGGLAEHSLEVATMVASARGLPEQDRELGIAFALLHDYGKVWCYDQQEPRSKDWRRHERIGLARLGPLLHRLRQESTEVGSLMEELLGGRRAPRDTTYPLAIGRIIHAFDQMSCEANQRISRMPF